MTRAAAIGWTIFVLVVSGVGPASGSASPIRATRDGLPRGFRPTAIAFIDDSKGIVGGTVACTTCTPRRSGEIGVTSDGGRHWTSVQQTIGVIREVTVAPGTDDAWAVVGRHVEESTDAGQTWRSLGRLGVRDLSFGTALDGWGIRSAAPAGTLEQTTDGGATWSPQPGPCGSSAQGVIDVSRTSATNGWVVCGGQGAAGSLLQVVYRTSDAGANWSRVFHGVAPDPRGYQFLDDGHGWRWHYVTSVLYGTHDGGAHWPRVGVVVNREVLVVAAWFVSDTDGFAIVARNSGEELVRSSDGGHAWSRVLGFPPIGARA